MVLVVVLVQLFLLCLQFSDSEFLVGSPAYNEISVAEVGSLRSVMISFAACFKKYSKFTTGEEYSLGMKVTVSKSCTWFVLWE